MSFESRLALVAALWAAAAGQGFAAPATTEGAAHLTEVLQRYLGKTEGVVTVTPEGKRYALTMDAAPLLALVPAEAATISVSAQHLTLTDQGGGMWAVTENERVSFTLDVPQTRLSTRICELLAQVTVLVCSFLRTRKAPFLRRTAAGGASDGAIRLIAARMAGWEAEPLLGAASMRDVIGALVAEAIVFVAMT